MRIFAIPLLCGALALGACTTTGADNAVGDASAKLAAQCNTLRLSVLLLDSATKQKNAATVAKASAAIETFCAAPPKDTASALVTVASILVLVQSL